MPKYKLQIKRVYDPVLESDGYRILIDRLWPRGVSKERAQLDEWMKDLGPSTELRKWFNHDDAKFPKFKELYLEELKEKEALLEHIKELASKQLVSLLFATKNTKSNHAVVLLEVLKA